jgi:hypothetical protein
MCVVACGTPTTRTGAQGSSGSASTPPFEVVAMLDLAADDPRSEELSGIVWDPERRVVLAISDEHPRIVELRPSADFRSWTFGEVMTVEGVTPWDGEGIAMHGKRLFMANEGPSRVVELDRAGRMRAELPLPAHFQSCRTNRCLESLSVTPDGRYLFTSNESTLAVDGPAPTADAGATVRILRIDLETGARREWAYLTDPVCTRGNDGEVGVVDLVALGGDEVLVLERSYVARVANRVRLFRVKLEGADVLAQPRLEAAPPPKKTFLFDIADWDAARPFVPNYEGICLGPRLADGRRLLFLVSDNNGHADQRATLLVVATRLVP